MRFLNVVKCQGITFWAWSKKNHLGFQIACAFWHFELMFGLVLAAFSNWFHPRRKCSPPSAVVRSPGSSASCNFPNYGSIRKLRNKLAPKIIGVFEQLIIGNTWTISVSNTGTWPCLQNLICIICLAETNTCTSWSNEHVNGGIGGIILFESFSIWRTRKNALVGETWPWDPGAGENLGNGYYRCLKTRFPQTSI